MLPNMAYRYNMAYCMICNIVLYLYIESVGGRNDSVAYVYITLIRDRLTFG